MALLACEHAYAGEALRKAWQSGGDAFAVVVSLPWGIA